jgi:hypothetical protein
MYLKSYVFTIWLKFRPLGVSESVTYQTHLADEVLQRQNFCRCIKGGEIDSWN